MEPRIWNCRIYFDELHRLTSLSSTWGTVMENLIVGFSAVWALSLREDSSELPVNAVKF
ncbi:predicted protein [Botrytis cinerea T4]|uniref:Uncharacterized protein n=1 Tax=Botryotinia fuckeliana (strain T4) TaxID=999810 RepID=G2YMC0_BOTF4|nr:predicted protein [Botrytis cinerea T4]